MSSLITTKKVVLQKGTGEYESGSFREIETIGTGQLYISQESGIVELRTMLDTAERYTHVVKGVAGAALDNADELAVRAAATVGKSILAAITHTPSGAARHIKVSTSMTGWEHDIAQLKASNYGMHEITKSIWSKKIKNIRKMFWDSDYILLQTYGFCCYRLMFASVREAKKCFSVLKDAGGFQ